MKRYRVLSYDLDSRPAILSLEIKEEWEEAVKEGHRRNKEQIARAFAQEFGEHGIQRKVQEFIDLGAKPFSILAFHNKFLEQIRNAFVIGAYYPALTGTCALGERILNHLMLLLREDFKATPQYKNVYRKNSFDNWDLPIDTLESWGALLPNAAVSFRKLRDIRNQTIHFKPEVDQNERQLALQAMHTINDIIQVQFGAIGSQPWFIPDVPGASFIKKEAEQQPFVKRVYLPNCAPVGPYHTLEFTGRGWIVRDQDYEEREISDDEFRELLQSKR
jgi:hypothetical protein